MSDLTATTEPDERASRVEMIAAIILGLAATLTAGSAYLAAKAGGDELAAFSEANAALSDANFFYQQANQTFAQDNQLFVSFIQADAVGAPTAFVEDLMRPELQAALAWWAETDEALTPFDEIEGNPYVVDTLTSAGELQERSDTRFADAAEVGEKGDYFDLANVVFALALFAAGIVSLFRRRVLQNAILGVAAAMLVGGVAVMGFGF